MKLEFKTPANPNYCATYVALGEILPLENCDSIAHTYIFGNPVIVGKDVEPGQLGLYFPPECALSHEFLSNNNLYRKTEWGNVNATSKGFFEQSGRVRAMKFRGHLSQGFFIPISCLSYLAMPYDTLRLGAQFDAIGTNPICKKYVRRFNPVRLQQIYNLLGGQLEFHYDTRNLRYFSDSILPENEIVITDKLHGTSAIFANLLTRRELKWYERWLSKFGLEFLTEKYQYVWTSRTVVKGIGNITDKDGLFENAKHYYSENIWGIVGAEILPLVPKGYTVYGEIVGYTPGGKAIQKGYAYGCEIGTHKFYVYRITFTTLDGHRLELTWEQVKKFCVDRAITHVPELFVGKASDICPTHVAEPVQLWQRDFIRACESYYVNRDCYFNSGMPAEGMVLSHRTGQVTALKLKSFAFLELETNQLDEVIDETEELIEE